MAKENSLKKINTQLKLTNRITEKTYPENFTGRQPVHTLYGGAHLFKINTVQKMCVLARKSFNDYADTSEKLASALGWDKKDKLNKLIHTKISLKLESEAVEDYRIDFEDGFGIRTDREENQTAEIAAREFANAMKENLLPEFSGIRIKSLSEEVKLRAVKTLEIFLTTLTEKSGGKIPDNFIITLPKVNSTGQIKVFVKILEQLENKLKIKNGKLKFEIMFETPQSVFDRKGRINIVPMIKASKGRMKAIHLGIYDLSLACEISPKYQTYINPLSDFVRQILVISAAGTRINISDGATNIIPSETHKGITLTEKQKKENSEVIHSAWKTAYENIFHSLKCGIYQGWDLHPSQIPVRYAAVYRFFLEGMEEIFYRYKNFKESYAQAAMTGSKFDDAATGQGFLNYFRRAFNCGAISLIELNEKEIKEEDLRSE